MGYIAGGIVKWVLCMIGVLALFFCRDLALIIMFPLLDMPPAWMASTIVVITSVFILSGIVFYLRHRKNLKAVIEDFAFVITGFQAVGMLVVSLIE